jgi:hypothetical protein
MRRYTIPSAIVAALLTCSIALGTDAAVRIYETGLSLAGGTLSSTATLGWTGRAQLSSPQDGHAMLTTAAGTSGFRLSAADADSFMRVMNRAGSAVASIGVADVNTASTGAVLFGSRGSIRFTADGKAQLLDTAGTAFDMLILGPATSAGAALKRTGTGLALRTGNDDGAGFLEAAERTEPDAPAANGARLFAQDNGGGKTQLCVRFASGASQCFATEP